MDPNNPYLNFAITASGDRAILCTEIKRKGRFIAVGSSTLSNDHFWILRLINEAIDVDTLHADLKGQLTHDECHVIVNVTKIARRGLHNRMRPRHP